MVNYIKFINDQNRCQVFKRMFFFFVYQESESVITKIIDLTVCPALKVALNSTTTLSYWKSHTTRQFLELNLPDLSKPLYKCLAEVVVLSVSHLVSLYVIKYQPLRPNLLVTYAYMFVRVFICLCVSVCPSLEVVLTLLDYFKSGTVFTKIFPHIVLRCTLYICVWVIKWNTQNILYRLIFHLMWSW